MRAQCIGIKCHPVLHAYKGGNDLSKPIVRYANHGTLGDIGMFGRDCCATGPTLARSARPEAVRTRTVTRSCSAPRRQVRGKDRVVVREPRGEATFALRQFHRLPPE